jgi:hypothetical protein
MASSAIADLRKNYNAVIAAYKKVKQSDTELWIKTRTPFDAEMLPDDDSIVVYSGTTGKAWLDEEFYDKVHCFVFPTRGEGYGLPLAEAMARGCVCIATNEVVGDFALHDAHAFLLDGVWVPLAGGHDFSYHGDIKASQIGRWKEPNINQLAGYMTKVYRDWEDGWHRGRATGARNVEYMRDEHTFTHTADGFVEVLKWVLRTR